LIDDIAMNVPISVLVVAHLNSAISHIMNWKCAYQTRGAPKD